MEKKDCKILIVEDDLFLANIYRVKLEREGFKVDIAGSGTRGLEKFGESKPNLIITEVMLTGIDGFQLIERLHDEGYKGLFVFLTKLGEKEDVQRGLDLGADAYFIKTQVTFREVLNKIKELMATCEV